MDLELIFGAKVKNGNYLLLTFSDEFIRIDNGDIIC